MQTTKTVISYEQWYTLACNKSPNMFLFRWPDLPNYIPDGFYFVLFIDNNKLVKVSICSNMLQIYSKATSFIAIPGHLHFDVVVLGYASMSNAQLQNNSTLEFWNIINIWFLISPFFISSVVHSSHVLPAPM